MAASTESSRRNSTSAVTSAAAIPFFMTAICSSSFFCLYYIKFKSSLPSNHLTLFPPVLQFCKKRHRKKLTHLVSKHASLSV